MKTIRLRTEVFSTFFLLLVFTLLLPGSGEAENATVNAKGYFRYTEQRNDGSTQDMPINNAKVKMCDNDGAVGCEAMAEGWTDENGYFEITGTGGDSDFLCFGNLDCGLPDPLVYVEADSNVAIVRKPLASTLNPTFPSYCFKSYSKINVPTGTVDFESITPGNGLKCQSEPVSATGEDGAWHIFNTIYEANKFMRFNTPAMNIPKTTAFWPDWDNQNFYRPPILFDGGAISLEASSAWDEAVIVHEYGHHIVTQYTNSGLELWTFPLLYQNGHCDPSHCVWEPENDPIAFFEGWPTFISAMVGRHNNYDNVYNLESHEDNGFTGQEDHIENFNAAILWDLYDAVDDDQHDDGAGRRDAYSVGINCMWNALVNSGNGSPSTSIHELWNGLKAGPCGGWTNWISEIYREHHIIMPQPDLASYLSGEPPASVVKGTSFLVASSVYNHGDEVTNTSVTNRYYLSIDTVLDVLDKSVGQHVVPSLNAGANYAMQISAAIPDTLPANDYYLIVCADAYGEVPESDETNNCRVSSTKIHVTVQDPSRPDLIVLSIGTNPATPVPGQSVSVTVTIKNQGTANAPLGMSSLPDSGFYVDFYKHLPAGTTPNPPGDAENFHCQLKGSLLDLELAPGETATCTGTVSYSAAGTYSMWAYADSTKVVAELNENNNVYGFQSITVQQPCTDSDGDGYSIEGGACGAVDCNDSNAAVNPGVAEVCNGLDDNCNGNIDEKGSGHILDVNTVALWRLNEASASSNAVDEAGIYHLTQFGSPDVITGQIGNGRLLNGSSKFFEGQGNAGLGTALNGDWTYEGWVYLDPSFSAQGQLFIYNGLAFSFNEPDTILAEVGIMADRKVYWHQWQTTGTYTETVSKTALQTGQYYHVAVSRSAEGGNLFTYRMYVNGILDTETTGVTGLSYAVSGASHYIGLGNFTSIAGFGTGGNVLNGRLDDTRISKVARTDAEILASYQVIGNVCTVCTDLDGDGYAIEGGACGAVDCNDSNSAIHPGAAEACNGVDDNCNGSIDEGVKNTYYRDADGDGYGNAIIAAQACTQPTGYVANSMDCNDSVASVHPGSTETCNGVDDNCSGQADEGVCYLPVRTVGASISYYPSLLEAISAALGSPVTIQTLVAELQGNVNFNRPISFTLNGGYNGDYSGVNGYTTLDGTLIVSRGSLAVNRLIIK